MVWTIIVVSLLAVVGAVAVFDALFFETWHMERADWY